VELVEIPSPAERHDNIVAYWVPARAPIAGQELELDYRLQSSLAAQDKYAGGRAIATRIGAGNAGTQEPSTRKFVIDFVGPWLKDLAQDAPIEVVLSASHAQLGPAVVQRNPETGGRRIFFEMHSESDKPVELRCFLRHAQKVLTETWSFQWTRE
jgi:glucans biosynthesis protein